MDPAGRRRHFLWEVIKYVNKLHIIPNDHKSWARTDKNEPREITREKMRNLPVYSIPPSEYSVFRNLWKISQIIMIHKPRKPLQE